MLLLRRLHKSAPQTMGPSEKAAVRKRVLVGSCNKILGLDRYSPFETRLYVTTLSV